MPANGFPRHYGDFHAAGDHSLPNFLAAPGDIEEELAIISEIVREWNLHHGDTHRARAELVNWRTHALPETGRRPQTLINQRVLDSCDLVVGIFWSRLGTPTGRALSGTVEEIVRGDRQDKPVMVYFSERPVPGGRSAGEEARIETFKKDFGQRALWWAYTKLTDFERDFRSHLATVMRELVGP